jgi:ArsR family transcriptional regulator
MDGSNKITDIKKLAELLKAMADETRITILTMLQEGEMCVCEIMDELPISQPAVSHHLKILRQAGLIGDRREGKWIYYSLNIEELKNACQLLQRQIIDPIGEGRQRQDACPHPRCDEC